MVLLVQALQVSKFFPLSKVAYGVTSILEAFATPIWKQISSMVFLNPFEANMVLLSVALQSLILTNVKNPARSALQLASISIVAEGSPQNFEKEAIAVSICSTLMLVSRPGVAMFTKLGGE